jgi:hypothetical protein
VCTRLKIEPPQAWYYHISLNFCTLVILLQVDPASGDETKTICEGCYKIENTSIFACSLIPSVKHYRWLHGAICCTTRNSVIYNQSLCNWHATGYCLQLSWSRL